jgi:hypothetical protein
MSEIDSACQAHAQDCYSTPRRPGFLYGPRGVLRRFNAPLALLFAVRASLRNRGLAATVRKAARMGFLKFGGRPRALPPSGPPSSKTGSILNLKPGELVVVKSFEEIRRTLDSKHQNHVLTFTGEMRSYCGMQFRVFKRLERLYNEYTHQHRSVKHTVLLEGVYCRGVGFGCDRACFHFWREAWLDRVDEPLNMPPDPHVGSCSR